MAAEVSDASMQALVSAFPEDIRSMVAEALTMYLEQEEEEEATVSVAGMEATVREYVPVELLPEDAELREACVCIALEVGGELGQDMDRKEEGEQGKASDRADEEEEAGEEDEGDEDESVPDEEEDLEDGECELCEREMPLTRHHVRPKEMHKRLKKKFGFTTAELSRTIDICRPCHNAVHHHYTNEELAMHYNTREALLECEPIRRFVKWASKQVPRSRRGLRSKR